jgi:hypothetical protein
MARPAEIDRQGHLGRIPDKIIPSFTSGVSLAKIALPIPATVRKF